MTSQIAFLQDAFPTAVIYNVWNWIDVTEERSKAAVFLVDFLDLHDDLISKRCDHLFTCLFSRKHIQNLGHRTAYVGAGVCEISSLLPNTWSIKDVSIALFWSQDELMDTNKVCAHMVKKMLAKDSNAHNFLIPLPIYHESASYFTIIIVLIIFSLVFITFSLAILAHFLIKKSYTQKFIILTSLNRSAANYTYFNYIYEQIIDKCKDIYSICEHLKPLTQKQRHVPSHVLIEDITRPPSKAATISKKDLYVDQNKKSQRNVTTRKRSRSLLTFISTATGENEASNIFYGQGRRKSSSKLKSRSNTPSIFGLSLIPSSKELLEQQTLYRENVSNMGNRRVQNSQLASTRQPSNTSSEKQKTKITEHSNDVNAADNFDNYTIDSITSEDQRRVCSFLPKKPNIIQTLDSRLRYLSDYTIEKITNLDNQYSYEIHTYKNKTVLFSQIIMPIWTSAQVFSKALNLQIMSDSKEYNFATIEGVFILVVDKIHNNRYILPQELVGICAFNKSSSFHFCMITNLGAYIPLVECLKKIKDSYNKSGFNYDSFYYNCNLRHEILKMKGQLPEDKKDIDNEFNDDQTYHNSSTIAEPELLTISTSECIPPSISLIETTYMSKDLSIISAPPLQEFQKIIASETINIPDLDTSNMSNKPCSNLERILQALNAQYISQSVTVAFLQLRPRQSMSTVENQQQQQQQQNRDNKVLFYKIQSSISQNTHEDIRNLSHAYETDEIPESDIYNAELPQISLLNDIQTINEDSISTRPFHYYDLATYSCHELMKESYSEPNCNYFYAEQTDDIMVYNAAQSTHGMLPPIYPKHTINSANNSDTNNQKHVETYGESLINLKAEDMILPPNHPHKSPQCHPESIPDIDSFENYDLQEVFDTLAYFGSSIRERVAQHLIKEFIGNKNSFTDIQYLDKHCILVKIDPISNGSEVSAKLNIKVEPFSILLRYINVIPRPTIAKTDICNTSSIDMYTRVILIYVEFITLLECTQSDIEELSSFFSKLRADVNYGSVIKRLIPLLKKFNMIMSKGQCSDSNKSSMLRDFLIDIFT